MVNRRILVTLLVLAMLLVPGVVWAGHQFQDVPDDHLFHDDIGWLAENRVTLGCNPPENDRFCPDDGVTRGEMAAFMRRLSEGQVVDARTVQGRPVSALGAGSVRADVEEVGFPGGVARSVASVRFRASATGGGVRITGHFTVDSQNVGLLWTVLDGGCASDQPVATAAVAGWSPPIPQAPASVSSTWIAAVAPGRHTVNLCAMGNDPDDALAIPFGGVSVTWVAQGLVPTGHAETEMVRISDLVEAMELRGESGGAE